MNIWTIIGILGTAAIGLGIGNYFTGGLIGQLINAFINILKDIIKWVADTAPRPLKLLIFILMFASITPLMYDATIGATKMCVGNTVKDVSWFQGIAYELYPQKIPGPSEVGISPKGDISTVDSNTVEGTFDSQENNATKGEVQDLGWMRVMTADFIDSETYESSTITIYAPLVSQRWIGPTLSADITTIPSFFIGPFPVPPVSIGEGLQAVQTQDAISIWWWFGDQNWRKYSICMETNEDSPNFGACILNPVYSGPGEDVCGNSLNNEFFNQPVGGVLYSYDSTTKEVWFKVSDKEEGWLGSLAQWLAGVIGKNAWGLRDCQTINSPQTPLNPSLNPIYVSFTIDGVDDPYSVPIYDAYYVPLVEPDNALWPLGNVGEERDPVEINRFADEFTGNKADTPTGDRLRFLQDAPIHENSGIISYFCDGTTEKAYDTQMKIMNINPFDFQTMLMLMLIVGIFLLYSKMNLFDVN